MTYTAKASETETLTSVRQGVPRSTWKSRIRRCYRVVFSTISRALQATAAVFIKFCRKFYLNKMVDVVRTHENACTRIIPARYVLAILASIGMAIVYGLKVNLGVAMVGMVNNTAIGAHNISTVMILEKIDTAQGALDECQAPINDSSSSSKEDGPFEWSGHIQGALKSAYFWGYLVAQIPGGRVAELFSAKWVMFFSVAINVVCTLLSPVAAKWHYGVFLFLRILEGVGGGVTFPAMHVMLAKWAPPNERSIMSSIVYSGTSLGTVIFTLVTGVIAAELGWEAIFYIEGAAAAIWLIFWILIVADTPKKQTFITEKERHFIVSSLDESEDAEANETNKIPTSKPPFPWKSVLTSIPFWAIVVAHTCSNWGWYMVLIELPNYMKSVLKLKIAQNAVLSSMPFLIMWIFSLVLSKTLDSLRSKQCITTTAARKISTAIASIGPMLCFLALCYIGCMRTLAIVLMTLAITSVAGMFCGYLSNHIDIAPNFAGTLIALTNTVATIPGIIVPIFVGYLTDSDPSINSWRIIFWVTIVLYIIEAVVFCLCASGEEQKWNKYHKNDLGEEQPLKSTNKSK